MKRILKLLLPAFFATGAFAFNITPFVHCVAYDPAAGMTTDYFGYESFEQSIITIPVGSDNRIIPDPPNRNQPTLFFPGYFEKAFRVTFSASSAVFLSFNGFAIPANSNSAACPATTYAPPTPALPPATAGVPYSQQLKAIGGQAGVTWSAVGTLPSGSLRSPTGLVSGIPLAPGQTSFTVQATDR